MLARPQVDEHGPSEMAAVIGAVERVARAEITRRAQLIAEVPRDLPPAFGNATQLGQVLLNLVINAAQAMPERPIAENRIEIIARTDGGRVAVAVRDNGAGIPDDVRPRIFDPFFTTKPCGVGTGLGLALSHRFVAAMNGEMTVDSAVGVGTTFTVALPQASVPLREVAGRRRLDGLGRH
jgi:signal transduction histidine kinase